MYLNSPIALKMNIAAIAQRPQFISQPGELNEVTPDFIKMESPKLKSPIATTRQSNKPGFITALLFCVVGIVATEGFLPPNAQ